MANLKSDFLRILTERGFIHQCSDTAGLDELAAKGELIAYVGYDCTAPSLHVGSLISIMMLHWLQQTGGKPIVLMGGGTTQVGDPSGKDETRKILTLEDIERNKTGMQQAFAKFLAFGSGKTDAAMVDNAEWLSRLNYIAFLRDVGRHFSVNRMLTMDQCQDAPRARAGAVVHRVQLHAAAGLRLRRAGAPLRVQAADGRLRPVGQHRHRHRSRAPHGHAAALRADLPAADDRVGRQDGQDRGRRHLAQRGAAVRLRLLAVLAQHRGRRRRALPEALHDAAARRGRQARRAARAPTSTRRRRRWRRKRRRCCTGARRPRRPRRRRARRSSKGRPPRACRPSSCRRPNLPAASAC